MNAKPVILVIDDDLPILTLMRNVLREFGFEATVASTEAAAIESFRTKAPHLVLLDKNMPGTSVREMIAALRKEGPNQVPIVILSGEPIERDEIQRLGAAGAVMKPFDVLDLVKRIRSHVGDAQNAAS
ncbi:MAG TPA: response regulator [Thermoanaerobaculia bacterium]